MAIDLLYPSCKVLAYDVTQLRKGRGGLHLAKSDGTMIC